MKNAVDELGRTSIDTARPDVVVKGPVFSVRPQQRSQAYGSDLAAKAPLRADSVANTYVGALGDERSEIRG